MFCHVSDTTFVKSSYKKDVVKTYWPFLPIQKFSETSQEVKWYSARALDFTRGNLSEF